MASIFPGTKHVAVNRQEARVPAVGQKAGNKPEDEPPNKLELVGVGCQAEGKPVCFAFCSPTLQVTDAFWFHRAAQTWSLKMESQ